MDEAHKDIAGQLTEISLTSLMYYFRYTSPYLYIILFLTQYVFMLPIWDKQNARLFRAVFVTFLLVLSASLLLAVGVSYTIWDTTLGTASLYRSTGALFGVQGIYWLINISLLFIIDFTAQKAKKEQKEE